MVKHVILWKLKDEHNTPEVKQGIKENLEALLGVVPGLLEIRVHTDPLATSNADVMLWSILQDEAALAGYAVHPAHVAAADNFVRPFTETRLCMDFED